jgi:uncharacterized membrane protein
MRVRNMFDRIGRYRIGVLLLMPLLVGAIIRVLTEDVPVTWRLILFWVGSVILIWAVVADALYVYLAKRRIHKIMNDVGRRDEDEDKV